MINLSLRAVGVAIYFNYCGLPRYAHKDGCLITVIIQNHSSDIKILMIKHQTKCHKGPFPLPNFNFVAAQIAL